MTYFRHYNPVSRCLHTSYSQVVINHSTDEAQLLLIDYWLWRLQACTKKLTTPHIVRWSSITILMKLNYHLLITDFGRLQACIKKLTTPHIVRWSSITIPMRLNYHLSSTDSLGLYHIYTTSHSRMVINHNTDEAQLLLIDHSFTDFVSRWIWHLIFPGVINKIYI